MTHSTETALPLSNPWKLLALETLKAYYSPCVTEVDLAGTLNKLATLEEQLDEAPALADRGLVACLLWLSGQVNKAQQLAHQVLLAHPEEGWSLWTLSHTNYAHQRIKQAKDLLKKAEAYLPKWMVGHCKSFAHELIYQQVLKDTGADPTEELPEKALDALTDHQLSRFTLGWQASWKTGWQWTQLVLKNGFSFLKPKQAARLWWHALHQAWPGEALWPLYLAETAAYDRDWAVAEFWFQQVVQRHPTQRRALWGLVQTLRQQERFSEALETAQPLRQLAPCNTDVMLLFGCLYEELKQTKQAVPYYEQVLWAEGPDTMKSLAALRLGQLHLERDPRQALTYLSTAQNLSTKYNPDIHSLATIASLELGKIEQAKLMAHQALSQAPNALQAAMHWGQLGYIASIQENWKEALDAYHQAIDHDPAWDVGLNNLAIVYLDALGQPGKAIPYLEKAVKLNPGYALAAMNLARAYEQLGVSEDAEFFWEQVHELERASSLNAPELLDEVEGLEASRLIEVEAQRETALLQWLFNKETEE